MTILDDTLKSRARFPDSSGFSAEIGTGALLYLGKAGAPIWRVDLRTLQRERAGVSLGAEEEWIYACDSDRRERVFKHVAGKGLEEADLTAGVWVAYESRTGADCPFRAKAVDGLVLTNDRREELNVYDPRSQKRIASIPSVKAFDSDRALLVTYSVSTGGGRLEYRDYRKLSQY